MLDIYSYLDYRKFLKDYFAFQKEEHGRFSFRYFAKVCGYSSPSFLKMVMDGHRKLSVAALQKLVAGMKLKTKEANYFETLVFYNQAKSEQDREHYFNRLQALRTPLKKKEIDKDLLEYYTKKHFVIIREMVSLPHFKEDPAWIGKQFSSHLTTKEVEHALEVLLRLGLIKRDEKEKLISVDATLATKPEIQSWEVHTFHREMLKEAIDVLMKIPPEWRDITCLTIPIPFSLLPELKTRIQNFRREIAHFINNGPQDFFDVYQLNIQFFPVTFTKGE